MSDEASPAWAALRASLAPTFPQLLELEAGGALAMDLGSDGWLLELTPDGRLLCQYGVAIDDVMTLLSDGTPEDLGTDEIAKQAKYFIQPAVSKYRALLLKSGFSEQTEMNDEYVAVRFERSVDVTNPIAVQDLMRWCVRTIGAGPVSRRIATFDDFRDAITAYRLPRVLIAALELNLFTAIGTDAWTIPDLARDVKVSERGLAILCRNLAMAGLLKKQGETYTNSRLGATALNAHHPAYRGDYLRLITSHWADWGRLLESVKSGLPLDHDEPDEPDYRRRFTWAMHHRTLETAPKIAAQINLRGARTLLDLGGGPGTYAMAFLAKNPTAPCHGVRPSRSPRRGEGDCVDSQGRCATLLSAVGFADGRHSRHLRCHLVFERAPHLFTARQSGAVSACVGFIESRRPPADSGCLSPRPRRVCFPKRRVSLRSRCCCSPRRAIPIRQPRRRPG